MNIPGTRLYSRQLRRQLRLDPVRTDHAVYTKQSSTYDTYYV